VRISDYSAAKKENLAPAREGQHVFAWIICAAAVIGICAAAIYFTLTSVMF